MPTANDSLDPERVLDALGKLKDLLESTSAGEVTAEEARTAAVVAARRTARELAEKAELPNEAKRAELEEVHRVELEGVERRHGERLAWIEAKYHAARNSLTDRIAQERDGKVGKVQAEVLKTQDERGREYAVAKEELGALRNKAAEDAEKIGELEKSALKSMRSFKPLIAGKLAGKGVKVAMDDEKNLFSRAEESLGHVKSAPMAKLFRFVPLTVWIVATIVVAAWLSGEPAKIMSWLPTAGIAIGGVLAIYGIAFASTMGSVARFAEALQRIRLAGATAVGAMEERVLGMKAEIQGEANSLRGELSETLISSETESQELIRRGTEKLETQLARLPEKEERLNERRLKGVELAHAKRLADWEANCAAEEAEREKAYQQKSDAADAVYEEALVGLNESWPKAVALRDDLAALTATSAERFPEWSREWLQAWNPPAEGSQVAPFGRMKVALSQLVARMPEDARFDLGDPAEFEVPMALGFPGHGSLRFEGDAAEAAGAINSVVLRLLATHPPGRVAFTFIDPVGLGRDYAGLMHLADYEDTIIHGRIWTQSQQIEERLAELNEHVEKVIQMYLRNEYETITEYNEQAGTIAEKYQFVVIAGFPTGMSDTAMARLRSLAASGARCGVFILIQVEPGKVIADEALDEELRKACLCLKEEDGKWMLEGGGEVILDHAPDDELETEIVHRLGKASVDSNRVEVPFSSITPEGDLWLEETGGELRVPIGRTGAKKLQYLSIGKGTKQHALIAGKTGSGKSTLFHVMVTNLALYCSPEEVEFYLVDFKKGVEFKCYGSKRLPHARVVAIESDREFGLSVLHRVDEELRTRGELFRECGAQDVAGYRKSTGKPLPRTLLMIDEFQEFFTEDDGTGQEASLLLDRIVRQGRAFGIHVILGSQTLGGAYTLARATLGQMVIRIALQCNEADAYLIMDDDNPAPRLLTRPGEGIYNDNAGAVASNSPFQAVWLGEEERNERLDEVVALGRERGISMPAPVVFEGNAPAELSDNELFEAALAKPPTEKPKAARAWLGAPNSIKGPTEAVFQKQSGSNLLMVGQGEDRMKAMLGGALLSLASQYPKSGVKLVVLDPEGDEGYLAELLKGVPQNGEVHLPGDLSQVMEELAKRMEAGEGDDVFVLVRDLQRFKSLKPEEEFSFSMDDSGGGKSPSAVFQELVTEGPAVGIHVLASVDTWNNVGRWIPRKAMSEFQMRVLFQMSGNDSAALIDTPAAGNLGLHRALLYNEAMGSLETFRPYARVTPRAL
ncbi:FtsK/SpoIIIE domain-containing protein [Haloferula sp.]|uniref:FtsK/SpoIIIE domain-containing protein n=1 Tax=Haloferula sp. TaxID=2497595 RepID=UPI00329B785D